MKYQAVEFKGYGYGNTQADCWGVWCDTPEEAWEIASSFMSPKHTAIFNDKGVLVGVPRVKVVPL